MVVSLWYCATLVGTVVTLPCSKLWYCSHCGGHCGATVVTAVTLRSLWCHGCGIVSLWCHWVLCLYGGHCGHSEVTVVATVVPFNATLVTLRFMWWILLLMWWCHCGGVTVVVSLWWFCVTVVLSRCVTVVLL